MHNIWIFITSLYSQKSRISEWWTNKQKVVYPYDEILFCLEKKWSTDTSYNNMNLQIMLVIEAEIIVVLYDSVYINKESIK